MDEAILMGMLSESARVTTAAEARFRVRTPNARPRSVIVVPLDGPAAALADGLAGRSWRGITFLTAPVLAVGDPASEQGSFGDWLRAVTGQAVEVAEEIGRVDVVQMLATAGHEAPAASLIGDAALLRGVKTSGLIIDDRDASAEALTRSLLALRPWVMTLSVVGSAEYVDEMLHALGG